MATRIKQESYLLTPEDMKRLWITLDMMQNGSTREIAEKNYDCEHGKCKCK